jgi:ectoine hydroxylase-related dioxygenase (phytanoyl-CoA dioxygenase family)
VGPAIRGVNDKREREDDMSTTTTLSRPRIPVQVAQADYDHFAAERISEAEVSRFAEDGAIILRGVIPGEWITRMQAAVDDVLGGASGAFGGDIHKKGNTGPFYQEFFVWRSNPEFRAFIFESPLAEIAARMMRATRVNFFYEQLLVKEPGTSERTPWHQDIPYWPVSGNRVISLWVPFDHSSPENGVVTYAKGSHRWGKLFEPRSFNANTSRVGSAGLEEAPDVDGDPSKYEFITGTLEPGDVFVHHACTLHGSPGNSSGSARRCALATRWTGDDARYFPSRPNQFLGKERFDAMRAAAVPKADGDRMDSDLVPVVWPRR